MTERSGIEVDVREVARAYTGGDSPPHVPGADVRKNDRGYYIRLDLEWLDTDEAASLLGKARERFDVEIAEQVFEDDELVKERRYVDSVTDVPDQYRPQRGPEGGVYYETNPVNSGGDDAPDAGAAAETVGYAGEPMLAVHFDDVAEGDRVAFERDDGDRDVGEVVEIDEDEHIVTVESGDGTTPVLAETYEVEKSLHKDCDGHHVGPGEFDGYELEEREMLCEEADEVFEEELIDGVEGKCPFCDEVVTVGEVYEQDHGGVENVDKDGDAGGDGSGDAGTLTSDTAGVHNERHSEVDLPDECRLCGANDRQEGAMVCAECTDDDVAKAEGKWVSFVGPEGGEGWVNLQTGEKRYQKERPGEGPEDLDEPKFPDGWDEAPDDADALLPGQTVEIYDGPGEEYYEGEYVEEHPAGGPAVETDEGDTLLIGDEYGTEITAVEEIGETHPEESGVSLDPDHADAEEWARQFEPGDTVPLDTSAVSITDEDAMEFEVMGWVNEEMNNSGWLAVHPNETFQEADPDATHIAVAEEQLLTEEEYEQALAEGSEDDEPDKGEYVDVGEDETVDPEQVSEGTGVFFERYDGQILNGEVVGTAGGISVEGEDGAVYPIPEDGEIQAIHESGTDAVTTPDGSDEETDTAPADPEAFAALEPGDTVIDAHHGEVEFVEYNEGDETAVIDGPIGEEAAPIDELEIPDETAGGSDDPQPTALPDEEDDDGDVHPAEQETYDLESYDPSDVEEYRDMSDIGANHGNSVAAMDVAVLPDGSKMVEKDVDHHSVTQDDIERELAGYKAGKHLDENIPTHVADLEEGWAASEVVPGVDAKDATDEMKEAVDTGDFVEMAATQVLLGNSDLHQNNVRVDEDGNLYPFDLDRCAGDVQGDWVGNLSHYDDSLDRMLGELEKSAEALDVDTGYGFRETIIDEAQQIANEIDGPTQHLIQEDVGEVNEEFAEQIAKNIAAFANGEVSL